MPDRRVIPSINRLLRFDIILRVFIILQVAQTSGLAWITPESVTAKLVVIGGMPAFITMFALTVSGLIGFIDFLVNDLLPERFVLSIFRKKRFLVYAGISAIYMILAMAGIDDELDPNDVIFLIFFLTSIVTGWYTWTMCLRGINEN